MRIAIIVATVSIAVSSAAFAQSRELAEQKQICFLQKPDRDLPDDDLKSYPVAIAERCVDIAKRMSDEMHANDTPETIKRRARNIEWLRERARLREKK